MSRNPNANESPVHTRSLAIAGAAGSSGVFASLANPFGRSVLIHSSQLEVTTQSTGAATVDAGVAADAVTSNGTLHSGQSVAAATIAGANNPQRWDADEFLNVSEASGDVDGLVAELHVQFSFV